MGNDIIQAEYDQLDAVAGRFGGQAEASQQLLARVRRSMQPLQQGGWQGRGSSAFFAEMNGEVLPAVQRLAAALDQARAVTLRIKDVMKAAEDEASRPFKGESDQLQGPATGPAGPAAETSSTSTNGQSAWEEMVEGLAMAQQLITLPNLAVTIPNIFAKGWLITGKGLLWEGPFLSRQLTKWRGELLAVTKPPAYGVLPHATDDAVKAFAQSQGKTRFAEYLSKSGGTLDVLGKGFAGLDFGISGINLINDPGVQTGADFGASGLGLWGALGSGPGAALAGAFSAGYSIGSTFIAPHTTEPLSNALLKADPLGINNNSLKYPRTTRNWYDRNNKVMPLGEAADVYQGLFNKYGHKEAEDFAKNYTQRADVSMSKFRGELPWFMRGNSGGMWSW